jgi:uncharacterized protein YjbI with pentapeptide repeats
MAIKRRRDVVEPVRPPEPPGAITRGAPAVLGEDEEYDDVVAEGADWADTEARAIHFRRARLHRAVLARSSLFGLSMADVTLTSCDLAGLQLQRAHLSRVYAASSRWVGAQLDHCAVSHVSAEDCSFEMALFANGKLETSRFERCVWGGAVFEGMSLRNLVFRGCDLRSADFRRSRLDGVDLRGCDIGGIGLVPDQLRGLVVDPAQAASLVAGWGARVAYEEE